MLEKRENKRVTKKSKERYAYLFVYLGYHCSEKKERENPLYQMQMIDVECIQTRSEREHQLSVSQRKKGWENEKGILLKIRIHYGFSFAFPYR